MAGGYIGLCVAAGGVVCGADSILDAVRRGRVRFLLISCDASERTKKQLTDKCNYYNVKYFLTQYDSAALAGLLGRRSFTVAAAFVGRGPWREALREMEAASNAPINDERLDERKDD